MATNKVERHPGELRVPPQSATDPEAFELLRVWATKGQQDVILKGLHNRDPAVWGVFLADLTRHIARSYHLTYATPLSDTIKVLREAYEAEMTNVTDWGEGNLL